MLNRNLNSLKTLVYLQNVLKKHVFPPNFKLRGIKGESNLFSYRIQEH